MAEPSQQREFYDDVVIYLPFLSNRSKRPIVPMEMPAVPQAFSLERQTLMVPQEALKPQPPGLV
jgi:hypothetical protein